MDKSHEKRAGGTIPIHEVRSVSAMIRLTEYHVKMAHRTETQIKKMTTLARWMAALAGLMAISIGIQLAVILL